MLKVIKTIENRKTRLLKFSIVLLVQASHRFTGKSEQNITTIKPFSLESKRTDGVTASLFVAQLACVASVSVGFGSKERDFWCFALAENGESLAPFSGCNSLLSNLTEMLATQAMAQCPVVKCDASW